jgi:hypothetical protein
VDRGAKHVEPVTRDGDYVAISGCELGAESCSRRPAAAAGGIVEIRARPVALQIIMNLVKYDRVVEDHTLVAQHLADLIGQPIPLDRCLAGSRARFVGQAATALL